MAENGFSVRFDGREYDIKRFLRDHPGGIRMLENYRGKSILEGMDRFQHSNSAYHMLNDFKVNQRKVHDDNDNFEVNQNGVHNDFYRVKVNQNGVHNDFYSFKVNENGVHNDFYSFKVNENGVHNDFDSFKVNQNGVYDDNDNFKASHKAVYDDNDNITDLKDTNLTGGVSDAGRILTKEESGRNMKEIAFLEELENRLDWSRPIFSQLDKIAPHYDTWVNSSVYRDLRLFESPLMESMTFTPWYLVPMFWIPVILYMAWWQMSELVFCGDSCPEDALSLLGYGYHVVVGVFVWTVVEYSLHRWVFHLDPGQSLTIIKLHFLIHGMHHKVPFDSLRQVFPPIPALVLASILYIPIHCIFTHPMVEMTGGLIGYLTYDMIHYYVHHGAPRDGSYLYDMKRYHSNHHFVNHDKGFGISNKLWDYVFRTVAHVKKLGFSLHW